MNGGSPCVSPPSALAANVVDTAEKLCQSNNSFNMFAAVTGCAGRLMRRLLTIGCATVWLAGAAAAAEPMGEWLTESGEAHIRIDNCGGALWGMISWQKDPNFLDQYNPDPAKRTRPTLGIHVLMAMKPTRPNLWEGEVYNAKNGRTYDAKISMVSADVLKIQGCVLGGLICGGEDWSRLPTPAAAPPPPRGTPARPAPPPVRTACSGVPGAPVR
jgi:uncharacterized protein (DUF2147 family)